MTSKTPVGTYRAPGRFESNFFRERLIDAGRDLGSSSGRNPPQNLVAVDEMPYSIGRLVPYETETAYDSGITRQRSTNAWRRLAGKKVKLQGT
jgi:carbon-monoxide dehydrogenase large subunit